MKENKQNSKLIFPSICYILAIIILLFYGIATIHPNLSMAINIKIIFLLSSCLLLFIGGLKLTKHLKDNKYMKINLWIFFILYLSLFISLTLFDMEFYRNWKFIWQASSTEISGYMANRVNLIPFNTIIEYIRSLNTMLDARSIIINLFGNLIACIPFAFFLPLLFKKQNSFKWFLLTMLLIILGVETMQLLTLSGSLDIDDLILNLSGAVVCFWIFKIKDMNNLIKNIFLGEKNPVEVKKLIKVFAGLFIILVVSLLLMVKIMKMYDNNYAEYDKFHNPNITFEYDQTPSENNLFYDDEIYNYYLKDYDASKFYVIANDTDKFTIRDFLDNSDYKCYIDRVLRKMKDQDIEYIEEHKYSYYEMKVDLTDKGYSISREVEDEFVKAIIINKKRDVFEINFIPKQVGETTIEIKFDIHDNIGNIEDTIVKKINVKVKKDYSVEYKEIA